MVAPGRVIWRGYRALLSEQAVAHLARDGDGVTSSGRTGAYERDASLDALRGIAIILVLVAHLTPVTFIPAPGSGVGRMLAMAISLVYREFTPMAVPVFLMVALGLYIEKRRQRGPHYFVIRLRRLLLITGTWIGVQYLAFFFRFDAMPTVTLRTVRLGGPSLVGAESTVFYFLIDLMMLVVATELVIGLDEAGHRFSARVLVGLLVIAPLCVFVSTEFRGVLVDHWLIVNFLPYAGIALLLKSVDRGRTVIWIPRLALLAVACLILDMALVAGVPGFSVDNLSSYARPSVVANSFLLYVWGTHRLRLAPPRWLTAIGALSLGLFALHDFFKVGFEPYLHAVSIQTVVGVVGLNVALVVGVVSATVVAALCLGRTRLSWMVR